MNWQDYFEIDPGRRSGKPCIKGTRFTIQDVLDYLGGGTSEAELISDFPFLTPEIIRACIAYAADRERRLIVHSDATVA